METVLQGRGLRRSFGDFWAVDGVDLDLHPGKITGLIGPNGAGKTTLLLMLAGMLAPTQGNITVAGMDYQTQPRQARAQIGWLPDSFGSWGELKVKEILSYFGCLYGLDAPTAAKRTRELLETVRLTEMADKYAHVLSRGQKQRLGVARTLLATPKVLLLDEPASGMDPGSRIELRELLRRQADSGVAVLVSSHILTELEDMVDDAIFMQGGKVVELSTLNTGDSGSKTGSLHYQLKILNPDKLADFLAQNPGEALKQLAPHEAELNVTDEATAADWLTRLVQAEVQVGAFTPAKQSLEKLYMQMEGGKRSE
ncbi:ABC transporter, ATP-binding protein [Mobiluncus mulieris 28-1]|uniref:ABC transporter ATP-binding protein n=1 Tax=Mobiluncus mulieris TaxID=2052 RepID=UPI0001BE7BB8|nr:ABC transporter ATP-binding protein [Mobiluncus mulieris]EEZ91816.1 ABC transporter, ATP-binding protein [Mobiluncus mulieris 28-1]